MRLLTILMVLALSLGATAQTASEVSTTGFITDTLCGKRGANALHVDHATRSVASGKAKYAIYDERTRQLYILDGSASLTTGPQGTIEQYLGQRVTITGTVTATPIRHAGQSLVEPDAAAAARGEGPQVVRHTPRAGAPLDTSTPVAGILNISSVAPAPSPTRVQ